MTELLAPAKDKICAKAAIDCGADAIYIGASEFGARKSVPNSLDDIEEVVNYAHKFNVRVYVVINTILTDSELEKATKLSKELQKIGVDALIIQDMGLLEALEEKIRDDKTFSIPLHASTQCDNRTPEKVKFLQDVGFSRVVLARELSLEKIKEIKNSTDIELEVFIHGALCVSYSGRCYLSYLIGGRSANRGECAQPCRKKYSLIDEDGKILAKDKHLLCLKDFNASKHIKELAQIGVSSFKIEGRLKDENYVKNTVAYYRKLIDGAGIKKPSSGRVFFDFEPNVEKTFNRGFTDYFLEKRKECFTFDSPKSRGEYLGKVSKIYKDFFEINKEVKINPQDGLCFKSSKGFSGCLVNKVEGIKIYPNKMDDIKIGQEIFRNSDSEFEKKLKNTKTSRKILAEINFETGKISAVDEDKNLAQIEFQFEEFAQNEEKMAQNIKNQLAKTGESDFYIEKIRISSDKIPFLPISKLNELRRELLEKLMEKRMENYRFVEPKKFKEQGVKLLDEIDYTGNVLNSKAVDFYQKRGMKVSQMAIESSLKNKGPKKAMLTKHCIKWAFNLCKSPKKLFLIDEKGKKYPLEFDCKNCEMGVLFE